MLLTIILDFVSIAGDLNTLTIHNYDTLEDSFKTDLNEVSELIPQEVFDYYTRLGGEVYFHDGIFSGYDENVYGLYYLQSHDIKIRSDESAINNPNYHQPNALIHEFGHFLYHEINPYINSELKNVLNNGYEYWSKYNPACYSLDETAATLYTWYLTQPELLNDELKNYFSEINNRCVDLLIYYNNYGYRMEIGPGIINN